MKSFDGRNVLAYTHRYHKVARSLLEAKGPGDHDSGKPGNQHLNGENEWDDGKFGEFVGAQLGSQFIKDCRIVSCAR